MPYIVVAKMEGKVLHFTEPDWPKTDKDLDWAVARLVTAKVEELIQGKDADFHIMGILDTAEIPLIKAYVTKTGINHQDPIHWKVEGNWAVWSPKQVEKVG